MTDYFNAASPLVTTQNINDERLKGLEGAAMLLAQKHDELVEQLQVTNRKLNRLAWGSVIWDFLLLASICGFLYFTRAAQ